MTKRSIRLKRFVILAVSIQLQLHGNEQPAYLKELEGYKLIKAFRVKEEDDLKYLANYKPHAFLLDSLREGCHGRDRSSF